MIAKAIKGIFNHKIFENIKKLLYFYIMKHILFFFFILFSNVSYGLTLKSGQVLGPDGKVYDGASPEQKIKIISSLSKKKIQLKLLIII